MQFANAIVSLLTAAVAVSASPITPPAEPTIEKRTCATAFPTPSSLRVSKGAPQTVTFNVPSGAVGACSLEAVFPSGWPIYGTNPTVDVRDVNGPAPGALVGTITFQSSEPRRVINSFACRPNMQYKFEIPDWVPYGIVEFSGSQNPAAGLVMTYNC